MRIPSRWLQTLTLAGVASVLAQAYPLPVYVKDNPTYLQSCIKATQEEFNQTYLEEFAFSQEGYFHLFTSLADWEAKRDAVKQGVMADATFTGLLSVYRGQLVSYRDLLALYETSRTQANADPADKAKKVALDGVKSSRNLVFQGIEATYHALQMRYAALRGWVRPTHR